MELKYFINRPILSIVIAVGIVFMGVLSLLSLPVEQYPDIAPPMVAVYTSYPGANAETENYGANYSMRIWLNPEKMAHYGLVPGDIHAALATQNIEAATGSFGENNDNVHQYMMKYRGRLSTPEEFEHIVLRSTPDGEVLRLGEVARIELGDETYSYKQTVNGLPASMVMLYQMAGSNASETIKEVDATLEELSKDLPKGLEFIKLSDASDFLDASIAD